MIAGINWNNGHPPAWSNNDINSETFFFQPNKDFETSLLDDCDTQDSYEAEKSPASRNIINVGNDQQMEIFGHKKNVYKTAITWTFIILSAGVLRLIFHWKPEWMLHCTTSPCKLYEAQQILLLERLKKFKIHIVRVVKVMKWNISSILENIPVSEASCKNITDNIDDDMSDNHKGIFSYPGIEYNHSEGYWYMKYFTCKKVTYIWNESLQNFNAVECFGNLSAHDIHKKQGLSESEQFVRKALFGPNIIDIEVKPILNLLFMEVLHPFYVFQIFSVCLWMAQAYYYYAVVIIIMSVASISISVVRIRKNQNMLKETVTTSDFIEVLRSDNSYQVVPSENIVPGDIISIPPHGCVMHCDAVLIQGHCIVNESMLTGESVPVTKIPFPQQPYSIQYSNKDHARYTLFCGTKVIQTRFVKGEKVIALVLRTGFYTMKGELVRSIMYPKPVDFKFTTDSYKFIGILAIIALSGFIYNMAIKITRHAEISSMIMDSLDLITITVPPALPAAMTVGILFASARLRKSLIYCISPNRINLAGLVDCVCFDKTGTLTEDGLDMLGVVPSLKQKFNYIVKDYASLGNELIVAGMATCHSLTIIDNELVGDPLDLKMFEATGWKLDEPEVDDTNKYNMLFPTIVTSPHPPTSNNISEGAGDNVLAELQNEFQLGIVRQFPFSSSLQRMSVITRILGADHFDFFCKGSPEMIRSLSSTSSIPEDFEEVLGEYTQHGYRVIAMAHKPLKLKYTRISKVSREELETDLQFLGLLVLENRLKPTTKSVISELSSAKIRVVMVTGDNMLTALSVARECGMVQMYDQVIMVSVKKKDGMDVRVEWNRLEYEHKHSNEATTVLQIDKPKFHFAISSPDLQLFTQHYPRLVPLLLTRCTIFARMGPSEKQVLIEELQGLGYYIAMCGDGANDCGALKAAHTGISLSEAEASVASPFTSKENDIRCVPKVIREGRAALVTSFGMFKYMAIYSLIQFISVIILYSVDSSLTDLQFLYIDLFLISLFAALFGYTQAYDGPLVSQKPPSRLVSLGPLLSLFSQIIIILVFQLATFLWLRTRSWFTPYDSENDPDEEYRCYENYVIFVISVFQYIGTVIIFSKARPFRKPLYTNYLLLLSIVFMTAFSVYLSIQPSAFLVQQFHFLVPPDSVFRWSLIGIAILNFLVSVFTECAIVDLLVMKLVKPKYLSYKPPRKKYCVIEKEVSKLNDWTPTPDMLECFANSLNKEGSCKGGHWSQSDRLTLNAGNLLYNGRTVRNDVEMCHTNGVTNIPDDKGCIQKSPL